MSIKIYTVMCEYFYGTAEFPERFDSNVLAESKEEAIKIFKELDAEYKNVIDDYNSGKPAYTGEKYLQVFAGELMILNPDDYTLTAYVE